MQGFGRTTWSGTKRRLSSNDDLPRNFVSVAISQNTHIVGRGTLVMDR